ncbi:MAG: hypothetical protein B6I38_10380 [Anaerolineaceae bacterium 4572_5.1]|nr:MAG: hypothetical protein B6I38_10380 [Anaerolineaceae bacterium 4572_5.1]
MKSVKRGDIFTVDLEPVRGAEQGKARPALVIALTSGNYVRFPVNVAVKAPEGGLKNDSLALLNQIRSIDKSRLGRHWGRLSAETMDRIDVALKISLGLK